MPEEGSGVRASYNTTAEVYSSGGYLTPGTLLYTCPSRLVLVDRIVPLDTHYQFARGYMTWDGPPLTTGDWSSLDGEVLINYALGDVVLFPSITPDVFQVLHCESVEIGGVISYYRAWLFSGGF